MADDDLQLDGADARVEEILRSMTAEDLELETPPDSIWAAIETDLAADRGKPADDDADRETGAADEGGASIAPVVSLTSRRRPAFLAAAAAAVVVVVAGLVFTLVGDDTDAVEVASAELVHLEDPGFVDEGIGRFVEVTLVEEGEREVVRVDAADLPQAGADRDLEIWLIGVTDGEIQVVRSLGVVEDPDDPGAFVVPDDFNRTVYDAVAVDVSVEPHDGDPDHSGMSLVRGPLVEI